MNNFNKALERVDESLRDWFKPHRDKRTGKKFKGWVNCRTGGPCSSKSKGGKYPVCRPTHAQCKPIKHKMHKKKGHARVQWKENLNENYSSATPPFGFFILRTEKVVPIPTIKDSDRVLFSIWPEARSADVYRSAGAIKMINEEDRFLLLYSPRTTSPQTLNLAYKVASHYNLPTADHTTLNESRYQVSGQIIFKDPFGTGRKYHPVDEIVDAASEGQAALKAAKRIAKQKGFRNSYYEVGRGYRVTALPDVQPPKPRLPYKDDDSQMDLFSEYFFRTAAGDQRVTDTSATAEAIYADGQDSTVPAVQTLTDQTGKESVIQDIIRDLEDLKVNHNWNTKLDDDLIKAMADTLEGIGVEPTDMYAAIGADARRQKQYLITGPSSWKGGNGALNDLKAILAGNEPQEIEEDESVPSSDLPYGSADSNPGMADLSEMNRREFIGKAARGAGAIASGNLMPGITGGILKGALGATSALGAASKINFDIDKIITNFINLNVEGADIIPTKDFKGTFLNNIKFEKKIYGDLFNAIKGNALSIPDDEVHNLGNHVTILGLFQNIITGKGTKEEIDTLDDYFDFEARFGKKRPSLLDLKELFEETSDIFNEDEAENLINSVLTDVFNRYQLKPETYKELSLHGYDWFHYVDSPEALRLRKQEAEEIAADNKKQQEEWQKQQELQQDQEKEKEQAYGSRFDHGGGEEDRAEEPPFWIDTFATDPSDMGQMIIYKTPWRDQAKPYGGPGTYTVDENFMDGKGPGRKGDSKRHGIKKKASLASLDKIVKSKTASPRKKQLAHWQANMRRGKAKKKR